MPVSKIKIIKNFVILLLGWTLTEGTISIVATIESSLNSDQGLGTVSLSVIRGSQILGCFLVNFVLNLIGCKWTAVLSSALCVPYVAIHYYPTWATMIPTSILQGIGNSFLGVARCVYLTKIAEEWAKHCRQERTSHIICFISIFDSLFYLLLMFMNVGSSFALGKMTVSFNSDEIKVSEGVINLCGYYYCNENLGTSFNLDENYDAIASNATDIIVRGLPKSSIYRFVSFCLISILVGCLLMILILDPLKSMGLIERKDARDNSKFTKLFKEAILQLKRPNMLLLLLMPIYSNTESSFYMADFTKAFPVCAYGMQYIGLVTAGVDLTAPISTFLSGFLSSSKLRPLPFVAAFIISGSVIITLMYSRVWIAHFPAMLTISGVWGISRGIMNSRVFAIFGVIFPDKPEVAYTACSLAFGMAGSVFFAIDNIVCVRKKVIALLSLLLLASTSYTIVEINVRNKQSQQPPETDILSTTDDNQSLPTQMLQN